MTYESNQLAKYQGYVRLQESTSLAHHGIKGQKWGLRRYQNEDGTLTEEGRERIQILRNRAHSDIHVKQRMINAARSSIGEYKNDPSKKHLVEVSKKSIRKYKRDIKESKERKKRFEEMLKTNVGNLTIKDLEDENRRNPRRNKDFALKFSDWFFGRETYLK